MRTAGGALYGVVLVVHLLARGQEFVEHEKIVAGVALRRVLPQFTLRDERVSTVDDDKLFQHLGVIHREHPGDVRAPVVADQNEFLIPARDLLDELPHVFDEVRHRVRLEPLRTRGQVVSAHVEADREMIASHLGYLILPLVPERRVAVQEQHERSSSDARIVQEYAVDLGVVVLNRGSRALRVQVGGGRKHRYEADQDRCRVSHVSSSEKPVTTTYWIAVLPLLMSG